MTLNDFQRDALAELINVAVSTAAVRLRAMVGSEVTLTVPAVSFVDPEEAASTMVSLGMDTVVAVRQGFSGALTGETLLVVPQRNSEELLRLVLGEFGDEEAVELYEDALKEIGNVLLAGFLSTIGKLIRRDFDIDLPTLTEGNPRDLLGAETERVVLFIYVNFGVRERRVTGYFAMVLGLESIAALQQIVDDVILQLA